MERNLTNQVLGPLAQSINNSLSRLLKIINCSGTTPIFLAKKLSIIQRLANLRRHLSTMAPTQSIKPHYQCLVIGGGSGGIAAARRAASYGASTIVVEAWKIGGTCVNVGCVPKKMMWNAADLATKLKQAKSYGFDVPNNIKFDWSAFKKKRDAYIERLNAIYERNLEKDHVDLVYGKAEFLNSKTVRIHRRAGGHVDVTADHILLAAGGAPTIPSEPKGADLGITSDGFFKLEKQPKVVALVGAGYISVELAGVFHALGSETHLFIRHNAVLRKFDKLIQNTVVDTFIKQGIHVHKEFSFEGDIRRTDDDRIEISYADVESGPKRKVVVDQLIWAVGRAPLSFDMGLDKANVEINEKGKVVVDKYQNTNVPHIYSLGDLSEDIELTPTAIAAGRKLMDRLFGGIVDAHLDYSNIPTVVFSHPEVGTIGLTEEQALHEYGDTVKIYQSEFVNLYFSPLEPEQKEKSIYKMICAGEEQKIVGLHIIGTASSEILQGFGVAIKMGATKADFDRCVAIHPTAAEELVTMR